jgi:amino acid adenylation domain-containing protein
MQVSVLEYFEGGALATRPLKVAVVDQEREFSFAELARCARRCAALILAHQPPLNAPVAVFLPKSAETIVADLAVLYAGNCYANLDVKSPPERLRATLANLGASLILTSGAHAAALLALGVPEARLLRVEAAMQARDAEDAGSNGAGAATDAALRARREAVIDTDPLCIIHTSGSTGVPKGVVLSHRGTIDFMDWTFARLGLDGSEVIGSLSPFYFDIYTLELYLCLAKGATLVLIPEQCAIFPAKLVEFLAQRAISFVFWVPTIMVNIANQNLLSGAALPALRRVFFAGEVFPTKSLNYWRRQLPGAQFVNLYGPIEISVDCTYFVVDRDFADDEKLPIGHPCRNSDILILDENDRPARDGAVGELCVRGSSLALGYWNSPERTAQAFVQNPLNPHYPELIYRTGDLVHRNERGEIMIVGRKDFQIKHLGYRIDLGEIEHAALKVEAIGNVCVIYDAPKKAITLYFESARELPAALIRERLAAFLPKYMLPTVLHRLESLPRNPNGKIDRQLLASRGIA